MLPAMIAKIQPPMMMLSITLSIVFSLLLLFLIMLSIILTYRRLSIAFFNYSGNNPMFFGVANHSIPTYNAYSIGSHCTVLNVINELC